MFSGACVGFTGVIIRSANFNGNFSASDSVVSSINCNIKLLRPIDASLSSKSSSLKRVSVGCQAKSFFSKSSASCGASKHHVDAQFALCAGGPSEVEKLPDWWFENLKLIGTLRSEDIGELSAELDCNGFTPR